MDPDQPAHPHSLIRINAFSPTNPIRSREIDSKQHGSQMLVANALYWFCLATVHIFYVFISDDGC
jgi:hypothetical protein